MTTISGPFNIDQNFIDTHSFPITLAGTGNYTVSITENIVLRYSTIQQYFIVGASNITLEGNGHTIQIANYNNPVNSAKNNISSQGYYIGLIQNGIVDSPGYNTFIVQNVHIDTQDGSQIDILCGWIGQSYFCGSVTNCSSTGNIGQYCGGICGSNAGNLSTCVITNCFSSGTIYGGGICGCNNDFNGASCLITRCYSTGIIQSNAGGIYGGHINDKTNCNNNTVTINHCYSIGNIGQSAGGIYGADKNSTVNSNNILRISNCYSEGEMIGENSGGICGSYLQVISNDTNISVLQCYSTGNMNKNCGGIVGAYAISGAENAILVISYCYSTGIIEGGGIIGRELCLKSKNNNTIVSYCYSTGNIVGESGGICCSAVHFNSSNCTLDIFQCYSRGDINGNSGGICGSDINNPATDCIVRLSNSYATGTIQTQDPTISAGGLFGKNINGSIQGCLVIIENCYFAPTEGLLLLYGSSSIIPNPIQTGCSFGWSNEIANFFLSPLDVWHSFAPFNEPYQLTSFFSAVREIETSGLTIVQNEPFSLTYIIPINQSPQRFFKGEYSLQDISGSTISSIIIEKSSNTIVFHNIILQTKGTIALFLVQNDPIFLDSFYVTVEPSAIICFKKGTQILCWIDNKDTYVSIQNIEEGTLVKTYKRGNIYGYKPVKYILKGILECSMKHSLNNLYKLSKKKDFRLIDDLYITGNHCLLKDKLTKKENNNMNSLFAYTKEMNIQYEKKIEDKYKLIAYYDDRMEECCQEGTEIIYHIVLEYSKKGKNAAIFANGILVESTDEKTAERVQLNVCKKALNRKEFK